MRDATSNRGKARTPLQELEPESKRETKQGTGQMFVNEDEAFREEWKRNATGGVFFEGKRRVA
jgi:hypothetical protein